MNSILYVESRDNINGASWSNSSMLVTKRLKLVSIASKLHERLKITKTKLISSSAIWNVAFIGTMSL